MASSSSSSEYARSLSDEDDEVMQEQSKPNFSKENLVKSLESLHARLLALEEQVEQLTKVFQEYSVYFEKQQELLLQEMRLLCIQACEIRKQLSGFP